MNLSKVFTFAEFLPGSPGVFRATREGNMKQMRFPVVAPVKPNMTSTEKKIKYFKLIK